MKDLGLALKLFLALVVTMLLIAGFAQSLVLLEKSFGIIAPIIGMLLFTFGLSYGGVKLMKA